MRGSIQSTAALVFAFGGASTLGDTLIYVGDYKFNDPRLWSVGPGGVGLTEHFIIPATDWLVVGLQVDVAADKIYWTHGSFNQGKIARANLDGTGVETLISGLTNPRGLALDVKGGKLYWSDTQDNRMYRANTDGKGQETIVDTGDQLGNPTLDLANQKIYFGNYGQGDIRRADLDGGNLEVLFADLWTPIAIALDLDAGKIYWADSNTSFVSNHIARANLDGTDREILYDGQPTSSGFTGIGLDLDAGKIYWTDEITESEKGLWEADIDRLGPTRIFESRTGWNAGCMTMVFMPDLDCVWDLDGDSVVSTTDLLDLLGAWGPNPGHPADFDRDGSVGTTDLLILLANWGPCA